MVLMVLSVILARCRAGSPDGPAGAL